MKKFIVLEGGDGTRKSSCAINLAKAINGVYYKTPPQLFKELQPSIEETKDSSLRFHYYLTSVLYASGEIKDLLKSTHVVCDRYIYSTIAYHRLLGVNVPTDTEQLVMIPDYCFCLYANEEVLRKRVRERLNLGVFDDNFGFQKEVFQQFKKFPLDFFETSDLSVEESVKKMLQKIRL